MRSLEYDVSAGRIALAMGSVLALGLAVASLGEIGAFFRDPDDAMRLVQVRDLLAGQAWTDWTQHRMQPPEGVPMHWSRVEDLPVALALLAFARLLGDRAAEAAAMTIWPVILLPVVALTVAAASRGDGRWSGWVKAGIAVAACCAPPFLPRFMPGHIDHHAAMTTLAAVATTTLIASKGRAAGAVAGACTALCLAIGFEDLAVLAALGIAAAALWLNGERDYPVGYAAGLAAATLLAAAAFVPPPMWTRTACDALSGAWMPLVAAPALALLSASLTTGKLRWIGAGAAAAAFVAAAASIGRDCSGGPFGSLSHTSVGFWLSNVGEMKSILAASGGRVDLVFAHLALPALALGLLAWKAAAGRLTPREAAYFFVLAVAAAFGAQFVRNAGLPAALSAPPIAAAILALANGGARARRAAQAIAVLALMPAVVGLQNAHDQSPREKAEIANAMLCSSAESWKEVASLPPSIIMTPIDVGAYALAHTPHSPVGGGYHRATRGLDAVVRFLISEPDVARKAVAETGARYVAWCADSNELKLVAKTARRSMASALEEGRLPSWLERIPTRGIVRVAKVVVDQQPRDVR